MMTTQLKCLTSALVMGAAVIMSSTLYGEEPIQEKVEMSSEQEGSSVGSELAFRCEACNELPEDAKCDCPEDRCNEGSDDNNCDCLVCR